MAFEILASLAIRSMRSATLLGVALLSVSLFVARPAAATVSFIVTELSGCTPAASQWDCLGETPLPGTRLTIGIRATGDLGLGVFGIGASVAEYDVGLVQFHSGEAVTSLFHAIAIPSIGAFDGLPNFAAPTLSESSLPGPGPRVEFLSAASLTPRFAQPLDPGLDGVVGGGDAQFRVRFDVVGSGLFQFRIGSSLHGDGVIGAGGVVLPFDGAFIGSTMEDGLYIVQVPEPTGLLLVGLGLVGLASLRR